MNAALLSSKNMCWCTPQDFFDKLNAEFGFVLDPAATDKTAKCSLYYTPETDGLSQSWDRGGAVFCNPPYGREIGKWVQKAFEEARGGVSDCFTYPSADGHGATEIYFSDSGKPEGIHTELADVIIRVLDYCGYAGIDIDAAISQKHEYNKSRPYRHGGKKC